jgi:hypothetical protein
MSLREELLGRKKRWNYLGSPTTMTLVYYKTGIITGSFSCLAAGLMLSTLPLVMRCDELVKQPRLHAHLHYACTHSACTVGAPMYKCHPQTPHNQQACTNVAEVAYKATCHF